DAGPWLDLWTVSRMDDIAVGCLLALAACVPEWRQRHLAACVPEWRQRLSGITARIPAVAFVAALFLGSQLLGTRFVGSRLLSPGAFALACAGSNTINAICIALLLWTAMTRPVGVGGWVLNCRLMIGIGAISYSLYLWHVLFCDPEPGIVNAFPQNIILMFAAALLSYLLIEKPFLGFKDRLVREHPAPVSPLAA